MEEKIRQAIADLLASGEVSGVVALKENIGTVTPCLFSKDDDLSVLRLSPRYPVAKLVHLLSKEDPDVKLGVVCRGCDERALIELAKRNQIVLDNIKVIGFACDEDTAQECNCVKPYTSTGILVGEKLENLELTDMYEKFKNMSTGEKLAFWKEQLNKCNKCYGCRNACQLCFCKECELENPLWVKRGRLPPEFPIYHLIRAFHLAGKCVGCGECEAACPAGIPLMTLNRLVRDDIKDLFDYVTGEDVEEVNPLYTKEEYE